LTAFIAYKAGCTHVLRDVERSGSKLNKNESLEAVTILEAPPMVVVGIVGYSETPKGLRALNTVWAAHLSDEVRRRFYKNWGASKKKAFTHYEQKIKNGEINIDEELKTMQKHCSVIRVLAHTQMKKLNMRQKKAHLIEVQINGGDTRTKIRYAKRLLEKPVSIDKVFNEGEVIDTIGITKGKGMKGVVSRWGVRRLPRKTHRGIRRVACIGAWHPARVRFTVARTGQKGYHHRTDVNKRIYRIGYGPAREDGSNGEMSFANNGSTSADPVPKNITPMGGFPHYGIVKQDFLMIKGAVVGPKKRAITLRKSMRSSTKRKHSEAINIRFIDTASKFGNGRFQTSKEKAAFMGPMKRARHIDE